MADNDPGLMFRLTVLDGDKVIFGPRTYLSDKTMIRALQQWSTKAAKKGWQVIREGAVRGAWMDLDAPKAGNHWSAWIQPGVKPCLPIPCVSDGPEMTQEDWDRVAPLYPTLVTYEAA